MAQITYADKSAINENPGVADTNKVNATDMNEIKSVVNTNDTSFVSATTYSTTETNTGILWTDGKPIYRKVITIGEVKTDADTTINTGITDADILIRIDGTFKRKGYEYLRYDISSTYFGEVNFNANTSILSLRGNSFNFISGILTIEYTKTTD